MNVEEARKDPERVARFRAVLANPDVQEMLGLTLLSAPCNSGVDPAITPQLSNIMHGAETGHFRFYNIFLSLGQHLTPPVSMDEAALTLEPEE